MTRIAIGGIFAFVGLTILAAIAMIIADHGWIMPEPSEVFTSAVQAIFWFCFGWLCGAKGKAAD